HVVAGEEVQQITAAAGFWGGLAHLLGLIVFGVLLAAVASVPGVVITHMTLLVQLQMDASQAAGDEASDVADVAPHQSDGAAPENKTTDKNP
ncbi:MAG: hypothetical protein Q9M25_10515, partial [Mariprofundaceae bacterium]|nr:hypothetical protein [Mariprofundaceae bacterium]